MSKGARKKKINWSAVNSIGKFYSFVIIFVSFSLSDFFFFFIARLLLYLEAEWLLGIRVCEEFLCWFFVGPFSLCGCVFSDFFLIVPLLSLSVCIYRQELGLGINFRLFYFENES
jgi:hypothetical protein